MNSKLKVLNGYVCAMTILLSVSSCKKESPSDEASVISASGDITQQINAFRQMLGQQLNTAPGATGGRREISWDGIPGELVGQPLPDNFFNPTDAAAPASNKRGLRYGAAGSFRVSQTGFADVNPAIAGEIESFSGNKSFANVSSNLWDVRFEVPGASQAAAVKGFGMVFLDVDKTNATHLEFFEGEKSIGKFPVPVHDTQTGFSFLGVYFRTRSITRVQVSHEGILQDGEPDISNGGTKDLVAMDDFLYSEPQAASF